MKQSEYVNMRRLNGANGKTYVIKIGLVAIQFGKEKAEFICRMLADWLGFELVEKKKFEMLKKKAKKAS